MLITTNSRWWLFIVCSADVATPGCSFYVAAVLFGEAKAYAMQLGNVGSQLLCGHGVVLAGGFYMAGVWFGAAKAAGFYVAGVWFGAAKAAGFYAVAVLAGRGRVRFKC